MPIILDASLILAWCFEDEYSEFADRVLSRAANETALVPAIWPLEAANGIVAAERRGRLTPAKLEQARSAVLSLPVEIREVSQAAALGPVLDAARAHGLTAYDASYLELAMREGLPLATQDETLAAAARTVGVALVE